MSEPLAWCNSRFMPLSQAGLCWWDAGCVYGAVLVDNARTFQRRLFRWAQHLERLRRHCHMMGITLPYADSLLLEIADTLIAHNGGLLSAHEELQVVTFVTPGPLGFYLGRSDNGPPTVGMMTYPLPRHRFRRFFTDGVTLEIVGQQSSDPQDLLPPAIKHRSRLMWYLAEQRKEEPTAIPVVINQYGLGDTPIGALVAVNSGTVLLPPRNWVLDSISLQYLRELCMQLNISVCEMAWDLRQLVQVHASASSAPASSLPSEFDGAASFDVDELLLVGTAFCIAGVSRLVYRNQHRCFQWPGPLYTRLLAAWEQAVGTPIARFFTA
jgi:branched-subunit amino acid aminotransferase/4-amino-4-deoxychorismate lyase